ncbi:MAG: hypothetical protein RLY86_4461 [Pseudomonadota bacterium]|jgi:hypothetical protein
MLKVRTAAMNGTISADIQSADGPGTNLTNLSGCSRFPNEGERHGQCQDR